MVAGDDAERLPVVGDLPTEERGARRRKERALHPRGARQVTLERPPLVDREALEADRDQRISAIARTAARGSVADPQSGRSRQRGVTWRRVAQLILALALQTRARTASQPLMHAAWRVAPSAAEGAPRSWREAGRAFASSDDLPGVVGVVLQDAEQQPAQRRIRRRRPAGRSASRRAPGRSRAGGDGSPRGARAPPSRPASEALFAVELPTASRPPGPARRPLRRRSGAAPRRARSRRGRRARAMLCAPATGRRTAAAAVIPASASVRDGPCQAPPRKERSSWSAKRTASVAGRVGGAAAWCGHITSLSG